MRVVLEALDNLLSCMQALYLPPPANTTSDKHESLNLLQAINTE